MAKEVQDYAVAEGYDLVVLDNVVLFRNEGVDITPEVLRAVEANYQATNTQ